MKTMTESRLLRIFIGETDKVGHTSLVERIIEAARKQGVAGATAWRGIMGYGRASTIHTTRLLDLGADLPVVIEIIDSDARIDAFLPRLHDLLTAAGCGGMVTTERVQTVRYTASAEGPLPGDRDAE